MMYTLLTLLLTTTALALPRPQAFWTGIPSVYIPDNYAGCTGGMPCPEYYMGQAERLLAEKAAREKAEREIANRQGGDMVDVAVKEKRQEEEAGVFYCKDVGWGGECLYRTSPLGSDPHDCTMMNLAASSVGPDQGYYCIFYTNAVCAPIASDSSDTLTLTYPGTDNLGFTEKGDFNDRLLSYQCFRKETVGLDPLETSGAEDREAAMEAMDEQGRM